MADKSMLVLAICLAVVLAAGFLVLPGKVHAMPAGWERPAPKAGQFVRDDDATEYGTAAPRHYDWGGRSLYRME